MARDFRGTREEEGKKSSSSSRAFLPSYVPLQLALNITPAPAMQAKHTFVVQCSRCFLTYVPSGTNYFGKLLLNDRLRAVFSFTRKSRALSVKTASIHAARSAMFYLRVWWILLDRSVKLCCASFLAF